MLQPKKEPDSPDLFSYMDSGIHNQSESDSKKKRVGKACDSCRIKKCRCDGRKPCTKCIADNKICVYSERKRPRDKVYPSGYVELLETRLDLLSKSLEKLIDLSIAGEDITFLKTPGEKFSVNKIINQLVNDHGLLNNLPVEWDTATKLLAELPDDNEGIVQVSNVYAEHAKQLSSAAEMAAVNKLKDKQERKKNKNKLRKAPSDSTNSSSSPDNVNVNQVINENSILSSTAPKPIKVKTEPLYDDRIDLTTDFSLKGFQPRDDFTTALDLGPFTSGLAIAAAAMEGGLSMSDFESDNNRAANNYSPVGTNSPFSDSEWNGSGLSNGDGKLSDDVLSSHSPLFLDTGKAASSHELLHGKSSYTSMNTVLFNENPPSNIHISPNSPKIEPQLRRSNSRPYSVSTTPAGKKLVNNHSGQIIKPHHNHHHRSNSFNNPLKVTTSIPSPEIKGLQSPSSFLSTKLLSDDLNMFDMISLSPAAGEGASIDTFDNSWLNEGN